MKLEQAWRPYASVIMILFSLFLVVFVKMEIRRLGYQVFKQAQIHKQVNEENRLKQLRLAKINRPTNIEKFAQNKLTLRSADSAQIIQLTDTKWW